MILRKLQQAPVRAMSDISPTLCSALADTKRNSGILQKDFLNISPEQQKISFLKCLALHLSFQKKYSTFYEPQIYHQTKVYHSYSPARIAQRILVDFARLLRAHSSADGLITSLEASL